MILHVVDGDVDVDDDLDVVVDVERALEILCMTLMTSLVRSGNSENNPSIPK